MFEGFGKPCAYARIRGGNGCPELSGTVKFYPCRNGTLVAVEVRGLPESAAGFFGLHVHEGCGCRGSGFPETGNHYDIAGMPHPQHAGDLPPLLGCGGYACMAVVTDRFRIRDVVGRTVVIHSDSDDFISQPSGNSGSKIACGEIVGYMHDVEHAKS